MVSCAQGELGHSIQVGFAGGLVDDMVWCLEETEQRKPTWVPSGTSHNSGGSGREGDAGGACKEAEKRWSEQQRTPGALKSHSLIKGAEEGERSGRRGLAGWSNTAKCQV